MNQSVFRRLLQIVIRITELNQMKAFKADCTTCKGSILYPRFPRKLKVVLAPSFVLIHVIEKAL
jgi:hypothetical protein